MPNVFLGKNHGSNGHRKQIVVLRREIVDRLLQGFTTFHNQSVGIYVALLRR